MIANLLAMVPVALVPALGRAIVDSVWQVTLVAVLAAALLATLRQSSASVRYVVASAALLLAIALPAGSAFIDIVAQPQLAVPATPSAFSNQPSMASVAPPADAGPGVGASGVGGVSRIDAAFPSMVAAWSLGVLLLSLRLLGGWLRVARLARRDVSAARAEWRDAFDRTVARMGIARGVRLVESAVVAVPTAIGWLRPVVLLPAAALSGLTPRQVEAIIAHELAHVRRYDYLANLAQVAIETLLFYHPAAWWLSARVRTEREHCCDDEAVAVAGDALGYARALTLLDQQRMDHSGALLLAATGGTLMNRIKRLRAAGRPCAASPVSLGVLVALLVLAAASGGVVRAAYAPAYTPPARAVAVTADGGEALACNRDLLSILGNEARQVWVRLRRQLTSWLGPVVPVDGPQAADRRSARTTRELERQRAELERAQAAIERERGRLALTDAQRAEIEAAVARAREATERAMATVREQMDAGQRARIDSSMAQARAALEQQRARLVREFNAERRARIDAALRDARNLLQRERVRTRTDLTAEQRAEIDSAMAQARKALEAARPQIEASLSPERRAEIDSAMAQARKALEAARPRIDASLSGERRAEIEAAMAQARKALEAARPQIEASLSSERRAEIEAAMAQARKALEAARPQIEASLSGERRAEIEAAMAQASKALEAARPRIAGSVAEALKSSEALAALERGRMAGLTARDRAELSRALAEARRALDRERQQLRRELDRMDRDNRQRPPVPPAAPRPPRAPRGRLQAPPPPPPAPPVPPAAPRPPRALRDRLQPPLPPAPPVPGAAPSAPPVPPPAAPPAPPVPRAAPAAPRVPPPAETGRLWSDDNGWRLRQSSDGRTLDMSVSGNMELTADGRDIKSLSPGGTVRIIERSGNSTVTFEARSIGGRIERNWVGLSDESSRRQWLADHLAALPGARR